MGVAVDSFRHEALLYAGDDEFLEVTVPFVADGVAAGEPVLVAVDAAKIERLRRALGPVDGAVRYVDMLEVGRNPACIIPVWRDFVVEHGSDRRVRGVGEPVWPERTPDEVAECHRHEALLNVAFADSPGWWLVCPYDTRALDGRVIDEAYRTHPFVAWGDGRHESPAYLGVDAFAAPFDAFLPDPPGRRDELAFRDGPLDELRRFVAGRAEASGLDESRTGDLVLAVNELATNSVRHGGGSGLLRVWREGDAVVCEVRDRGRIVEPLVGRERPAPDQDHGRGLWLVNQLCDLVQIRATGDGGVVRVHMRRR